MDETEGRERGALVIAVVCALGAGLAAGGYVSWFHDATRTPSDFALIWTTARAWLNGTDPYTVIGPEPGRLLPFPYHLIYPLPAVIVAVPFTLMPLRIAEGVFAGAGVAAMTWTLTRRRPWPPTLWLFASFAFLQMLQAVQWTPALMAAALTPSFGWLLIVKPSIGLPLFLAYPSRWAIVGGSFFLGLTILFWPWWVPEWLALVRTDTAHVTAPIAQWGGPLLALAALRWRRTDARLLLALACVPHTPELYDLLPLFLLATCLEEGMILVTLILLAHLVRVQLLPQPESLLQVFTVNARVFTLMVYLPCLAMVLRRKNVRDDTALAIR